MLRLIDADALTGYVTELYEYDLCHADADDYTEGRASAEHGILEKIRELPTIDAIPVEWLRDMMEENGRYAEPYFAFAYVLHEWQQTKSIEEQQAESEMRDWKAEREAET